MATPNYAVCNQSDDSVIMYVGSYNDAQKTASEVRNGDFDNNPRECWIRDEDTEEPEELECQGHPAGPYDPMGQTVYCDGSCRR